MLKTLHKAFSIKEIRDRLLFTLFMLVVIRLGSQIPVPGVNPDFLAATLKAAGTGDAFSFFDAFTGGSFFNMSVFALNITPYITASIIVQLLTIAIPKLEEMHKDGEDGRKKIASITRYVTVAFALLESTAMAVGFGSRGLLNNYATFSAGMKVFATVTVILSLLAGSTVLMWIGERITDKGVGNGISVVLTFNIVSRVPQDMIALFKQFVTGQDAAKTVAWRILAAVFILAVIVGMVVFVVYLNGGTREIPVAYARKMQNSPTGGAQKHNIKLKINTAGVIPIIFASSLFQTPVVLSTMFQYNGTGVWSHMLKGLNSNNWFSPGQWQYSLGLLVYSALIVVFAYFYTSLTFNPREVSDNLKKQGAAIPGIKQGKPTTQYIQNVLKYIIFIGACGLVIITVVPDFFNGVFAAKVSFGGTSLIIIVSVILETLKQIDSKMLVRNYKGFLD